MKSLGRNCWGQPKEAINFQWNKTPRERKTHGNPVPKAWPHPHSLLILYPRFSRLVAEFIPKRWDWDVECRSFISDQLYRKTGVGGFLHIGKICFFKLEIFPNSLQKKQNIWNQHLDSIYPVNKIQFSHILFPFAALCGSFTSYWRGYPKIYTFLSLAGLGHGDLA